MKIFSSELKHQGYIEALNHTTLLFGGILIILMVMSSVLEHSPTIWSMEDSYLYHTFGHYLSQGRFFTYSINEPPANGNTSFLYYLIVSGVHGIARMIKSSDDLNTITLALWITFGLHSLLYLMNIALFARLLLRSIGIRPIVGFLICAGTFFNGPMVYAFFCGLESPLTISIIVLFITGVLIKSTRLELISLVLMALNRPESMAVAVIYAIFRYGRLVVKSRRFTLFMPALIVVLSSSVVPLLNFMFIGQLSPTSAARIGLHATEGELSLLYSFLDRLISPIWMVKAVKVVIVSIVPWAILTEQSNNLLDVVGRTLLSIFWTIGVLTVVIRVVFQRGNRLHGAIIPSMAIFTLWTTIVVILGGGTGEFNRYIVVVFPLVAFLGASVVKLYEPQPRLRWALVLLLSFSLIPSLASLAGVVSHIRNGTYFLRTLHYQSALTIRSDPDVESVAVWETGVLSLFLTDKKRVIDLYGLGPMVADRRKSTNLSKINLIYWFSGLPGETMRRLNNSSSRD